VLMDVALSVAGLEAIAVHDSLLKLDYDSLLVGVGVTSVLA